MGGRGEGSKPGGRRKKTAACPVSVDCFLTNGRRGRMHRIRVLAIGLGMAMVCRGQEGTAVFLSRCIQCHDPNSESHAPLPEALSQMPWQDIVKALETGSMKGIG